MDAMTDIITKLLLAQTLMLLMAALLYAGLRYALQYCLKEPQHYYTRMGLHSKLSMSLPVIVVLSAIVMIQWIIHWILS